MRTATLFLLLTTLLSAQAQTETGILDPISFRALVLEHHPVARQAQLVANRGDAAVLAARGGFDPYLLGSLDQKQYDGQEYFTHLSTGIKANTRLGVALKAGYDLNRGTFLNPENKVPDDGLFYAGVSVPIGRGLLIDDRRAALQQAVITRESNEAEQRLMLNNLLLEAFDQYWQWYEAYNTMKVLDSALGLTLIRLDAVKRSFEVGEKPAIDTVEAVTQVQNRLVGLNKAIIQYVKASRELSNYLWRDGETPLVITPEVVPPTAALLPAPNLEPFALSSLDSLVNAHPEVQLYALKVDFLDVERRLKFQKNLPTVNLEYNFLRASTGGNDIENGWSTNDYKWGLNFSLPVPMRQGRGETQLAKHKIQEAKLGGLQKKTEVRNKNNASAENLITYQNQVRVMSNAVTSYQMLLNGERTKFQAGESSLFLVNSREVGLIEVLIKQIEATSAFRLEEARLQWAAGILANP